MAKRTKTSVIDAATSATMPGFIKPQLATLKSKAPKGAQWLHEIKYDGYRVQIHLNKGRKKVFNRLPSHPDTQGAEQRRGYSGEAVSRLSTHTALDAIPMARLPASSTTAMGSSIFPPARDGWRPRHPTSSGFPSQHERSGPLRRGFSFGAIALKILYLTL